MKILIVDESPTIRNIQRNVLKQIGLTDVLEAADGINALRVFYESAPDLLLIDWNMPKMDGLTLLKRIRELNSSVPIIMCTTEADKNRVFEAVKAGVNNYIVKPFTVESLGEKISQTVAKSQAAAS